jgi:hypothetical protein
MYLEQHQAVVTTSSCSSRVVVPISNVAHPEGYTAGLKENRLFGITESQPDGWQLAKSGRAGSEIRYRSVDVVPLTTRVSVLLSSTWQSSGSENGVVNERSCCVAVDAARLVLRDMIWNV